MSDFISEFRERRVLPAIGVYIGGSWVLIEILDRLVERYLLSPYLTDVAFWGLYSLIPAVILIAWTHGKPGKDKVTTAEKVGVPINLIATTGLLLTMFSGKDLGAAAQLVTVSDEYGAEVSQYVAREGYRRRVAMFFWDNETGDPANDWLRYGATELLTQDLQQSPFIVASSPWNTGPNGMYLQMQQGGFEDGLDLPVNLMRRISQDWNREHFVDGSVGKAGDEWVVTARVWETRTAGMVGTVEERGWDLYSVMDKVSLGVREVLDVPSGGRAAEDLALADTYGESSDAFQSYINGLNARLFENDFIAANRYMDEALEHDSQFVLAWFIKGQLAASGGDLGGAQAAFQQAQSMDFRLPSQDQVLVKANLYRMAGENDKLESYLRMQIRLNDDARSRKLLADVLLNAGQLEDSRQLYMEAMERDSADIGILLNLARIERATDAPDEAIEFVRLYLERKPEDSNATLLLGDLLREVGDLDGAAAAYQEAQFLDTDPVTSMVRLSQLAGTRGDTDEALALLEEAALESTSPAQLSQVLGAEMMVYARHGQIRRLLETLEEKRLQDEQFMPPIAVILSQTPERVIHNINIDRIDEARRAQDEGMSALQPPMNQFLAFNEAMILAYEGDFIGAEAALARGVAIMEQFQLKALEFQVQLSRAKLADYRDDPAEVASQLTLALEHMRNSIIGGLPELMNIVPDLMGWKAIAQIQSGDLDGAQRTVEHGFKLDGSNPNLWMARAELQLAWGKPDLARASLAYTFAIWKDADPDFVSLREARDLEQRIEVRMMASE